MNEVNNSIANKVEILFNSGNSFIEAFNKAKDISYQNVIRMSVLSYNEVLGIDYKKMHRYAWLHKLNKEIEEQSDAFYKQDEENELEELQDIIQLCIQRIHMLCKNDKIKLSEANRKHNQKLTDRGWIEEKSLEINIYGKIE